MHSLRLGLALLVLAGLAAGAARPGEGDKEKAKEKEKFKLSPEEEKVLELVNEARKEKELPPLKVSRLLTEVARKHSENMGKQRKLDHKLDDKGPGERLKDAGYASLGWGENIYGGLKGKGAQVAEVAFKWWMNSEGHRANILTGQFRETGIGFARSERGEVYFTQVFALPRKR